MNAQSNHPFPASTIRQFVVEASDSDPTTRRGDKHDKPADCETHASRAATNRRVRFFLQRGLWVEVYDGATSELLAGPFDPEQAPPAYIV